MNIGDFVNILRSFCRKPCVQISGFGHVKVEKWEFSEAYLENKISYEEFF